MSDSIWKKEISFKKKDKPVAKPADSAASPAEAAAPAEQKQSLLKKEISFGRKKDKAPSLEQLESLAAPVEQKQSFLKKEISFKRDKPAAKPAEAASAEPKQSFLKKEISFGRKKQERTIEQLSAEAAQAFAAPEPQPAPTALPTELAEAAVTAMPVEPVEQIPAPVYELPTPPPAPAFEQPVYEQPVAEVPAFEQPVHEAPPPAPSIGLSPEIVAASVDAPPAPALEPVELAPVEPEPLAPEALPVDLAYQPVSDGYEPLPLEPEWPTPDPAAYAPLVEPVPEPWLAEPEVPPAPEEPAPVVLHPPVPAAELDPVVAPKQPFWKKDLSLSRGAKQPKAPKAPKQPKPAGEKFWKKELSLKKKETPAAAPEATTEAMPVVAAPKQSRLKRDVSLSLPKLSLPKSGGGKGGGSAKRYVGLKIGASQLAAARVSNNGSVELLQVARDPLAHGIVVAGELREPDALTDALKTFFARHKLPRKNVRLGIASNRIGVRIFDVVGIDDDKQLANAIQFRAQEALPIPLDEAVLDYRVLDSTTDAEGRPTKRVLLVVAYRDLVDRYVSACRKAGIGLVGIDLEAFALLRALEAPHERGNAATVAVSIGHDRSTFAVTDGRVCEFTRVLEWGGWSLNVALARALDTAPSEVEAVKRAMSLDTNMVIEGLTPEQSATALDAVRRQLQSFARELVSSLQFYQNQPGSLAIGSIVITGGTAHMPGLAIELERLIGVRVLIGDPLARVKMSKKLATPEPVGSLAVAIGLGIED